MVKVNIAGQTGLNAEQYGAMLIFLSNPKINAFFNMNSGILKHQTINKS
jgi:hypothetical protein